MAVLKDLETLIALCQEHTITYLKFGDIEINLGPQPANSAEAAPDSVASLNSGGASAECVSDYENPDLWGDAGDPVASLRAHKEARLASRQANGEIDGT